MMYTECPICGGTLQPNVRSFPSKPVFRIVIDELEFTGCAYVCYDQCETCKAFVQNPRMSDEDIDKYYRTSYRKWLGIPQDVLDRDEDLRARQDASIIRRFIGEVSSHLDLGSSRGYLLNWVGAGVQVGIELNGEYNRNDNAYVVPALPELDPNVTYDLVSAIHMLEHTTHPIGMLKEMVRRSNKWIVVEVPSDKSPGGWGRLAHTFHFPEETLLYMAKQVGCEIYGIFTTPHTFVLMEKLHEV